MNKRKKKKLQKKFGRRKYKDITVQDILTHTYKDSPRQLVYRLNPFFALTERLDREDNISKEVKNDDS